MIEKSKGSHMWDIDGNEYVDVLNGFGMCLFGWQPDFVQEAVRAQLELGCESRSTQHAPAGEVAELICEMTGADRAGLCRAHQLRKPLMAAIRIARTVTCRNTIVVFTGSYHGTFDEVLVRAGRNAKGIPAAPGIMADVFADVRVLDYGTPESLEYIRRNADDLAAVLIEPVQSRRPDFQPREFLKQVREITEASGTCMIMDEVITGFRVHPGVRGGVRHRRSRSGLRLKGDRRRLPDRRGGRQARVHGRAGRRRMALRRRVGAYRGRHPVAGTFVRCTRWPWRPPRRRCCI